MNDNRIREDGRRRDRPILSDFHAALLQSFIAKRVITIDDALVIFEEIAEATGLGSSRQPY